MFLSPYGELVKYCANWWTLVNLCICLNIPRSGLRGLWYLKERERFLYERNAGTVVIKHGTLLMCTQVWEEAPTSPGQPYWSRLHIEKTRELRCQWFDKHRLFVCLPVSCRGLQNLPVTMTDGMGLRKRYFRPSDNSLVSEVIRIPRLG